MPVHPPRNRCAAWLAILAIALNASWPAFALAKPEALTLPLELCTAAGLATSSTHGQAPTAPSGEVGHAAHCAFCSPGAAKLFALPSAPLHAADRSTATHARPALLDPIPSGTVPLPGRPRAPPIGS